MNTPIADRQCARVETKGPTVTAGESLAAAVGPEVPMRFTLPEVTEDERVHLMFVLSKHGNDTGDRRSLDLLRLIHDDMVEFERRVKALLEGM